MKELFIIGNGFDIAHGLKTGYDNFVKYIEKEYPYIDKEIYEIPSPRVTRHGEVEYDEKDLVSYIFKTISDTLGYEWKYFEDALGEIDFMGEYLDDLYPIDKEGDLDMWKISYMNQEASSICEDYCRFLSKMFTDWIRNVDLTVINNKFTMIKKENIYINFNYTKTLEVIYNIPDENILHIHGVLPNELVFGHGKTEEEIWLENEEIVGTYAIGSENNVSEARERLRKKTEEVIDNNREYFHNLKKEGIKKIYVYGFSFSNVDLPYISELLNNLSDEIEWKVYYYGDKIELLNQIKKTKIKKYDLVECGKFK